jgi:hypothetical protein
MTGSACMLLALANINRMPKPEDANLNLHEPTHNTECLSHTHTHTHAHTLARSLSRACALSLSHTHTLSIFHTHL